jgi:hypothetical protein
VEISWGRIFTHRPRTSTQLPCTLQYPFLYPHRCTHTHYWLLSIWTSVDLPTFIFTMPGFLDIPLEMRWTVTAMYSTARSQHDGPAFCKSFLQQSAFEEIVVLWSYWSPQSQHVRTYSKSKGDCISVQKAFSD